jgi:hypothetical protein
MWGFTPFYSLLTYITIILIEPVCAYLFSMTVSRPRHADGEAGEERPKLRRTIETPISFTPLIENERMHTRK